MKKIKQYFLNKPSKYKKFELVCNWLVIILPIIWTIDWFLLPVATRNLFTSTNPFAEQQETLSAFDIYLVAIAELALKIIFYLWILILLFKLVQFIMRWSSKKGQRTK